MTPFGQRLRDLRGERGLTLKQMAADLGVSPAYLSALEHGHRGRPNRRFVHRVCQALNIIWDDAEELQRLADLSHPRVTVDTSGLSPEATELANRLSEQIHGLDSQTLERMLADLRTRAADGAGAQDHAAQDHAAHHTGAQDTGAQDTGDGHDDSGDQPLHSRRSA